MNCRNPKLTWPTLAWSVWRMRSSSARTVSRSLANLARLSKLSESIVRNFRLISGPKPGPGIRALMSGRAWGSFIRLTDMSIAPVKLPMVGAGTPMNRLAVVYPRPRVLRVVLMLLLGRLKLMPVCACTNGADTSTRAIATIHHRIRIAPRLTDTPRSALEIIPPRPTGGKGSAVKAGAWFPGIGRRRPSLPPSSSGTPAARRSPGRPPRRRGRSGWRTGRAGTAPAGRPPQTAR